MDTKRRIILQASVGIAATVLAFPPGLLSTDPWERLSSATLRPADMSAETLSQFARLVEIGWMLSNGNDLRTASQLLSICLPQLATFALHPSEHQVAAARLVSQGYQLSYV